MLHPLKPALLEAMKESLRDLENVRLLIPGDLDIVEQKRALREKIAKLEIELVGA